ncbi:hypothetical protein KIW84_023317 [Lathyrus oleraceus]|uniref:Uncharacterized protein n=1 Tax=Pisum sativum TaxID=3888 RepID=A0A9D4YDG7_PEA|nr:hypothetical protein KIW84_023317 [Pisum sativum]
MENSNPVATPMASTTKLIKTGSAALSDASHYRSIVRPLQYATITRPEICYAVNKTVDILTKPLSSSRFMELNSKLNLSASSQPLQPP